MGATARREQAQFWRDDDLDGMEVLHATFVTHRFVPHMHEGFVVSIVERGAESFDYRGALHTALHGSMSVLNPAEVHTGQAAVDEGWSYRVIYPSVALMQQAASALAGKPCATPFFDGPIFDDPPLVAMLRRLHASLADDAPQLERESRLLWALAQVVARHASAPPAPAAIGDEHVAVARSRDYLDAHLDRAVTLDELAAVVNLSPFHLIRVFRGATGLPPHAYLAQRRVARAKALLADGVPVARAAAETGFADQSHLTRQFKRVVGVPPGQFAANRKIVQDARR